MTDVHYRELGDGVALIELDRPEVHNALDRPAQLAIDRVLTDAAANESVRALVLAGAGDRALSAGWDIAEMRALDPGENLRLAVEREEWLWRWFTSPVPTVVAMRGIAYGVGALLAACADLRVGGPGTRFKVTGMSYGYPALTWWLPELLGQSRATEVLLTGVVGGRAGADVGLLNRYVESDDQVREAAVALARRVAELPAAGVREAKTLMRAPLRARYDAENTVARRALLDQSADEIFAPFLHRKD